MKKRLTWNKDLFRQVSVRHDLIAAFTVAIIIIPQGMAYSVLAGLPPIYGLYSAFVPLLLYPMFGSSRHLSVGPVALVSIILFAGLSSLAQPGSAEFIKLAILTSFIAGFIQILLAVFRMGFLVKFLSEPVVHGFTSAAATIIIFSQLKSILGITISSSSTLLEIIKGLAANIQNTHVLTVLIGVSAILVILVLKKIKKSIPAGILAVVIGTILLYLFNWHESGVKIVGDVPAGLPSLSYDFLNWNKVLQVLPLAFVICLISFIESLAISKSLASRHQYTIDANRELLGLGLSKLVGAFFQAFPNTGSFSRSAVNEESGGRSGFSSIFAGLFIGFILLFFTPLFYYLPVPILGAIVITAVLGLLNFPYARKLFLIDRKDFYVYLVTFLLTLVLGVQQGVFIGILLSIIMIIQKTSKPHFAILGSLPGTRSFRNVQRYPNASTMNHVLIMRYDQDIYFGNAEHFYDTVTDQIRLHPLAHTFILNASAIGNIDSTGISQLNLLLEFFDRNKIRLLMTHVRGPVRDKFTETNLFKRIGQEHIYLTINDALSSLESTNEQSALSRSYANQSSKDSKKDR